MSDSPSIEFVQGKQDPREFACPVCSEAVGPAPQACLFCDTPHHFDCWEYNGGCGVYGCQAKPREGPAPEKNTVDLPAKLGMPHKRTGSYDGTWFVPPIAGVSSVLFEIVSISFFAAGDPVSGLAWLGAMVACLAWIAFSSVHYYVDFEKMRISWAKSVAGYDLLEWGVTDLTNIARLEVQSTRGPVAHDDPTRLKGVPFRVVAVRKTGGVIEICPPIRFGDPDLAEVADLFRRVEASGAFPVEIPEAVKKLPPPRQNSLLGDDHGKG